MGFKRGRGPIFLGFIVFLFENFGIFWELQVFICTSTPPVCVKFKIKLSSTLTELEIKSFFLIICNSTSTDHLHYTFIDDRRLFGGAGIKFETKFENLRKLMSNEWGYGYGDMGREPEVDG